MAEIFNSIFELSLRALLILNTAKHPLTEEEIATADFISAYGTDFGIAGSNLHGDNSYKYCESATRREKMSAALRELALRELIELVLSRKTGIEYRINKNGELFCSSLESTYANDYSVYSERALQYISARGIKAIRAEILSKSQSNIRRDGNA